MRPLSILVATLAAMVFVSLSVTAADVTPPTLEPDEGYSSQTLEADTTNPRYESWVQYPREINVTDGPASIFVEFRMSDDESGIESPAPRNFVMQAVSSTTSQTSSYAEISVVSESADGLNNSYAAEMVVEQGAAPGRWYVRASYPTDKQGNKQAGWGPPDEYDTTFMVIENTPAPETVLQVILEEPAAGLVHMGVGNLRGWAVSSVGIRKVEAYLDGEFLAEIPYGGTRGDVGAVFPDISGSRLSGFSMSLNYSGLSAGSHTLEIIAESIDNKTMSSSVEFQTIRFDSEFIGPGEVIDLNAAASVLSGDEMRVENISIAGKSYNLLLRWRTAEQGFEIVELVPLD